jgi:DNA-binding transcriptional regulator GbsR (MarR family)
LNKKAGSGNSRQGLRVLPDVRWFMAYSRNTEISSPHPLVIPAGRPAAVVAFESDVVDFFVDAAELLGVPKSLAAIYGIVFASPAPLSFADIEARLDLSKGSISQGLRALREVGAVQEVSKREDPTELFAPDFEMRRLVGRYLSSRIAPHLNSGRTRLSTLEARVSRLPPRDLEFFIPRLKKLQAWHSKARALLPVIKTFLSAQ